MQSVRFVAAIASIIIPLLGGLGSSGCGATDPLALCPSEGACAALMVDAPELGGVVIDQLEVVVRTASGSRTDVVRDRTLRLPAQVPVRLTELDDTPGQEINLYLRATWNGAVGQRLELSASLRLPAGAPPRTEQAVSLFRPCTTMGCPSPAQRQNAAMSYDPRTHRVVLFGGSRGDRVLDDTWEWDGARWYEVVAAQRPPARSGHAMAYDPQRGRTLLFGGMSVAVTNTVLPGLGMAPLADTWEYVGAPAGWRRVAMDGPAPAARSLPAMSTAPLGVAGQDEGTGLGILLFGGVGSDGAALGDTWLWDGWRWRERADLAVPCGDYPALLDRAPRCRVGAAMALAQSMTVPMTIMLGGVIGRSAVGTEVFDDIVWRWDGAGWARLPVESPPHVLRRANHRLVAVAGQLLVSGGEADRMILGDAFLLDPQQGFFVPQLGLGPLGRSGAAMAYDEERGEAVLAGGRGADGELADTWTFRAQRGWTIRR